MMECGNIGIMAGNGWILLKNCWNVCKWMEMDENGWKWLKIAGSG